MWRVRGSSRALGARWHVESQIVGIQAGGSKPGGVNARAAVLVGGWWLAYVGHSDRALLRACQHQRHPNYRCHAAKGLPLLRHWREGSRLPFLFFLGRHFCFFSVAIFCFFSVAIFVFFSVAIFVFGDCCLKHRSSVTSLSLVDDGLHPFDIVMAHIASSMMAYTHSANLKNNWRSDEQ